MQINSSISRNKWILFIGLMLIMLVLTGLSLIWAWTSNQNATQADRQKGTAIAEANNRVAITEGPAKTAIADANNRAASAERQAKMALARQLAAQSQALLTSESAEQIPSILLAIQSMRLSPSGEASQTLQSNTLAYPVSKFSHNGNAYAAIALSPETQSGTGGMYIATTGWDKTARVWETLTGKEISHVTYDVDVNIVTFSPNGKYVLSAGCDKLNNYSTSSCIQASARVWDALTGKEIARMTHPDKIYYAAFSPNGEYVVSGGCNRLQDSYNAYVLCADGAPRVWQTSTGKEIARLQHGSYVSSVSFSPDGKHILTSACEKEIIAEFYSCTERSVRVWEIPSGKEIARITYPSRVTIKNINYAGELLSAAFSPATRSDVGGKYILSVYDKLVLVSDALTGKEIARKTYLDNVTSAAFSPDGKWVLAIEGANAHIWVATTGEEILSKRLDGKISFAAFSPVGIWSTGTKYVLSADGKTVHVWDAETGVEVARRTHNERLSFASFSPDGKYVISGGDQVVVWDALTGKEIASLTHIETNEPPIAAASFGTGSTLWGTDSKYVFTRSESGVRLWKLPIIQEVVGPNGNHLADMMTFSPNTLSDTGAKYVASSSERNPLQIWEAETGKAIFEIQKDYLTAAAFSSDKKYLAFGQIASGAYSWEASTDIVTVVDLATGKTVASLKQDGGEISTVAFSPDNKYLVSGGYNKIIYIWEIESGKEIRRISTNNAIFSVAFSPYTPSGIGGKYIVSGSGDHTASIWEVATGKEIMRLQHDDSVIFVGFSLDGKWIISTSYDAKIHLWEFSTGKEFAQINTNDGISSVALSPDNKHLISGGFKGAHIWEIATGREIASIKQDDVKAVAFSEDGSDAYSGSADDTVRIWKWRSADLIADACLRVLRNLSRAEWQEYIGNVLPYQAICPNFPIEAEVAPMPYIPPTPYATP